VSYLLEALKRLEEKRQLPTSSDLLAVQTGCGKRERKKRAVWPYVLSAALLVNAGVVTWWLVSRHGAPHVTPPAATQGRNETRPGHDAAAIGSTYRDVDSPTHGGQQTHDTDVIPIGNKRLSAAQTLKENDVIKGTKEAAVLSTAPGDRLSDKAEGHRQMEIPAKPGQPIPRAAFSDNGPGDSKKSPPAEMKISLHSYNSDPASRLARIDDKTVREGDSIAPGIKVEEITRDGVIINNRGRRIRLAVQQGQ
jgi:general secretion pathway protein B